MLQDTSILATIASPFAVLLIPLGFGAWQLAAAAITGFIAKENVVGTLAVVYSITNFIDTDELALTGGANQVAMTMGLTHCNGTGLPDVQPLYTTLLRSDRCYELRNEER